MELQHPYFERNNIKAFQTKIDKCAITMEMKGNCLGVSVCGRKNEDKLLELSLELLSLMFIYLGGFPSIKQVYCNEKSVDVSNWAGKYTTDQYFQKNVLVIGRFEQLYFCQERLDAYRDIPQLPIYSLQYLVSDNYKNLVTNHKITLLTHVIDGGIDDSILKKTTPEMKSKYKIQNNSGDYPVKVYFLLKRTFFKHNRKFSAGILSILRCSQYQFIMTVSDTRNSYSHFLKPNKKPNRLTKGREMLVYFEIIMFALRLEMFSMIGIEVEEDAAKEYWYVIHDWIKEITNKKNICYKSKTYKIREGMEEMNRALKILQERGELN